MRVAWALAVYWLAGCVIIGGGLGQLEARCPNDEHPDMRATVLMVLIWPEQLVRGVFAGPRFQVGHMPCEK